MAHWLNAPSKSSDASYIPGTQRPPGSESFSPIPGSVCQVSLKTACAVQLGYTDFFYMPWHTQQSADCQPQCTGIFQNNAQVSDILVYREARIEERSLNLRVPVLQVCQKTACVARLHTGFLKSPGKQSTALSRRG